MTDHGRDWDRRMAARLMAGDESALGVVYDSYSPLIFGIAANLVGATGAADICQEVFVHLWQHPDRFDPDRGSLKTFLAMVARRRAIDQLRKQNRDEAREERVARGAIEDRPTTPDDAAIANLEARSVAEAVKGLPDDQRQALELAYYEGLTYRQVAAALGIPEGTAKSRLRRALAAMAQLLDGEVEAGHPPGAAATTSTTSTETGRSDRGANR